MLYTLCAVWGLFALINAKGNGNSNKGKGNRKNNKNGGKKVHTDADDSDIPRSIRFGSLPVDENVQFNVPDEIQDDLLGDQDDFLTGACKRIYDAYSDGVRMEKIKYVLGNQAYNAVMASLLYDYSTGKCKWTDDFFGTMVGDWKYVPKSKAGMFKNIAEHGNLAKEVTDYIAYWLEQRVMHGDALYGDEQGPEEWKKEIQHRFALLHEHSNNGQDGERGKGSRKKNLICERVDPVNFFREPMDTYDDQNQGNLGDEYNYNPDGSVMDEFMGLGGMTLSKAEIQAEMEAIEALNANEDDAELKRADAVMGWLMDAKNSDIAGPKDKDGEPDPTGYTIAATFIADVCLGVCIKIGAGLTFNVITNEVYVHWTYGLGATDEYTPDQDVRIIVSHYCESTVNWGNTWQAGVEYDSHMNFNHMYTEGWDRFLGFSLDLGYLHTDHDLPAFEDRMVKFGWLHNTRLATRDLENSKKVKAMAKKKEKMEAEAAVGRTAIPLTGNDGAVVAEEVEDAVTLPKRHGGGDANESKLWSRFGLTIAFAALGVSMAIAWFYFKKYSAGAKVAHVDESTPLMTYA